MAEKSRILVVDDDPIMQRVLLNVLQPEGYVLETASEGKIALNKVASFEPDLVLLDVMLPGMDGFDVCRQIRSNSQFGDLPVIFITALDDQKSRLQGIEAGADEFLSKPINSVELRARVRTSTQLRRFRKLVSERSKFEKILELAPEGILVVDKDANIRLSNQAIRTMLGVPDNTSILLHKIFHFLPKEYRETMGRNLESLLVDNTQPISFELQFRREDGSVFPAEVSASYFPWESQPSVQIYIRNVEDKKLMERQFLRMQRMQSIGTLAGGIAHDLNNALTPILVATHLARGHVQDTPAARLVETIEKSAMRGKDIIKQILSFARGVEGERRLVQLKYIVKEVEKIMMQTLPPSIELSSEIGEEPAPIIGDATQLHQVLMNLCVNARDAMPAGGSLHISLENEFLEPDRAKHLEAPTAGAYVRMDVADTGSGIEPDIVDKIFEPFFTTKSIGSGTGLGLSSSLGIVKSHGGFIDVDSTPGKGTTFHVYVPAAATTELATEEYETTFIRKGKGELVLVIDDEPAIREMVEASLKHYGYDVVTAKDGQEGTELFIAMRGRIAVCIIDFLMPGMNGGEVVDSIRAVDRNAQMIMMTGYGEMQTVIDVATEKKIRYLIKPFTVEAMLESIHRILA